jgi:hypothetical protein
MAEPAAEPDQAPARGGLTVVPIPGGWLVGRVMDEADDGKLWDQIGANRKLKNAVRLALDNRTSTQKVWLNEETHRYSEVPVAGLPDRDD